MTDKPEQGRIFNPDPTIKYQAAKEALGKADFRIKDLESEERHRFDERLKKAEAACAVMREALCWKCKKSHDYPCSCLDPRDTVLDTLPISIQHHLDRVAALEKVVEALEAISRLTWKPMPGGPSDTTWNENGLLAYVGKVHILAKNALALAALASQAAKEKP